MKQRICVLGGTGFVGQHLVSELAEAGHEVVVPSRHPERHRELLVLPTVKLVEANVFDPARLTQLFAGQDTVINLVGILNERRDNGKDFHRVHVELADQIVAACQAREVPRLLHMSALHADAQQGASYYLRSKGEAEDRVHRATGIDVTSFRPSVIFGPGDHFINRFAELLRKMPGVFPLACGLARFAPVYVRDVARAYVRSLRMPSTYGQRYNLCGPHEYTLQALVQEIARMLDRKRSVISLGNFASRLQANLMEYAPGKPFSRDNYRSLQVDSICPEGDAVLREVFGIEPSSIEAEVPRYLLRQELRERYYEYRRLARR
ncbi:MAG TPA: complex I NDUFA9 subunit family protein [Chromatiales bacterium]|nr:complex I NDUFA9 subunit family protein [Chromatiales bacterium]